MANTLEYIFSLQDKVSAKIGNITVTSDRMLGKFAELEKKNLSVNKTFNETGRTLGALREKIALLQAEREWLPADNIEGIRAYNREMKALNKEINKLESLNGGKFKKWKEEAFSAIPSYMTNPLALGTAVIGFAGRSGMSFDENMAKVNITAQLSGESLAELRNKLKQVAIDNKTDIQIAPVGFEKINSQLNDVDLSLSILDASLKGSKAGFTDLDTVSGALAQTLSIVGKENTTAMEVLDTFFAAKRVGAGEFADFARYMPNLIAGASNLGIAYKEVAGTFAYMTGKGQSAERAAVLMENAFSVLGRADVRGKMEKAGVKVFDDTGKIRSVVDIFSDLQGVMGSLNDEQKSSLLEKLGLVDKEAKNAFAIMISDTVKLRESMNEVSNSSGETGKALEFSKNTMQKATEVWESFKNIGTSIGELVLPAINVGLDVASVVLSGLCTVVDAIGSLFSWWYAQLQDGNPLIWGLTAAITALSAGLLINYARTKSVILLEKAKVVWDGIQAGATWLLTGAQLAFNTALWACPLTWVAAAIGAVVAAIVYCWQKFEGFRRVIYGCWETVKEFGRVLIDSIVAPFKQVLSGLGKVCSALVSLVKGNFREAAKEAKAGFMDIGKGVLGANPVSIGMDIKQRGDWQAAWDKGTQRGCESWQASQDKKNGVGSSSFPVPEVPAAAVTPQVDYDALMKKLAKSSKSKKVLNLNDAGTVRNYNESSDYTAATRKLSPLQVNLAPGASTSAVGASDKALDARSRLADAAKASDNAQEYTSEKNGYLQDIMLNVRKIAAMITVPLAMNTPVSSGSVSDAYVMQDTRSMTEKAESGYRGERQLRTIRIDRVCDQITIHVQNTDGKGIDTIRQEIINVFNEIYEV